MRSFALVALLAGAAIANPVPQGFDWDAIDSLDPVPTADVPVVDAEAAATTLIYASATAAASVSSAVLASPTDASLKARQATSQNTASQSDTAENWLAESTWANDANSALTPAGYNLVYQNAAGSSERVYGYMGYSTLDSYDAGVCASRCNAVTGCLSFNIYYERDPAVDATDDYPLPASVTVIKCVYWGGAITPGSPTNVGQYRKQFHVVIAGSNGYISNTIATPAGYSGVQSLGQGAINALNDCNGGYTYMGVKVFSSGVFDIGKCAAACSAQSAYNRAHPAKNGYFQTCQFFNTYILYNNSVPIGQYCSLYNETWPAAYATNTGQYRGKNKYTIGYSFAFSNSTGNVDQPQGCVNKASP